MRIDPLRLMRLGELIRQGSFRRAADKLGITQPALSQSIAQMEAEAGVRFIDRTPQGIVPTVYGQALIEHARAIEWQLASAANKIGELAKGHAGILAMGGTSGGAINLLSMAICRLREKMPQVEANIVEEIWSTSLLDRIDDRTLDFAVCNRPDETELGGKVAVPFFRARRLLCVRADHPQAGDLRLAALSRFPIACPGGEWGIGSEIRRIFGLMHFEFPAHQLISTNSLASAKQVVLSSDAFAVMSDLSILQEVRHGTFAVAALDDLAAEYWYYLVVREDHLVTPLLMSFITAFCEVCVGLGVDVHPEIRLQREGRPLRRQSLETSQP